MDINKKKLEVQLNNGDKFLANLRWFRGANRYNNGATHYKDKYHFRFIIGRAKQFSIKRSQDSNPYLIGN